MAKTKRNKQIQLPLSPEKYIRNRCRNLPIGKCLINNSWKEDGIANIFITREHSNGNLTVGMYLVDIFCLGVKDTFYRFNISTIEFRDMIDDVKHELNIVPIDYPLAHNIIFGSIEYAQDYGFTPHKDFAKTSLYILQDDDDNVELIELEFGFKGKPFLIINDENQPYLSYMRTLDETAGPGNYDFLLPSGESTEGNDNDFEDEEYYEFINPTRFSDDIEEKIKQEIKQIDTWNEKEWNDAKSGKKELLLETSIRMTEVAFMNQFTEEEIEDAYNFSEKLFDIEIDDEPLMEEEDLLPDEYDMDRFINALELLSENKPKEALRIFKSLFAKHTDKPILLNYMIICLMFNGMKRKADDLVIYAYQKFSDELMIKNQYLWYLLRNNRYKEIEKVLDSKFTLQDIYPQKVSFIENHALDFFKAIFTFFLYSNKQLKAKAVLFKLKIYGLEENEEEMFNDLMLYAIEDFIENLVADNKLEDKN
ncbi:MAG: hypothetical protein H8E34_06140 [Bacteroidetes bacterium]|nr:hypothetical protein [Bacteroidota bacterium]MBL6944584.1 hypothetical protein [Bacteroidales bacterium]